jgi:hypothetical protein
MTVARCALCQEATALLQRRTGPSVVVAWCSPGCLRRASRQEDSLTETSMQSSLKSIHLAHRGYRLSRLLAAGNALEGMFPCGTQ